MTTKSRFYLNCPYADKDEAKELGARWDNAKRQWFVPDGVDINLFEKWWPKKWLPIHPCFPDIQELEEKIGAVTGVLDNLQDVIQHEIQVAFEPDLYVEPPTAFETFQQEVRECAEWKKDNPEFWQTVLNEEIDVETYALCILSPDLRKRLVN